MKVPLIAVNANRFWLHFFNNKLLMLLWGRDRLWHNHDVSRVRVHNEQEDMLSLYQGLVWTRHPFEITKSYPRWFLDGKMPVWSDHHFFFFMFSVCWVNVVPKCWVHCILNRWMQWELIFGRETADLRRVTAPRLGRQTRSATVGRFTCRLHLILVET